MIVSKRSPLYIELFWHRYFCLSFGAIIALIAVTGVYWPARKLQAATTNLIDSFPIEEANSKTQPSSNTSTSTATNETGNETGSGEEEIQKIISDSVEDWQSTNRSEKGSRKATPLELIDQSKLESFTDQKSKNKPLPVPKKLNDSLLSKRLPKRPIVSNPSSTSGLEIRNQITQKSNFSDLSATAEDSDQDWQPRQTEKKNNSTMPRTMPRAIKEKKSPIQQIHHSELQPVPIGEEFLPLGSLPGNADSSASTDSSASMDSIDGPILKSPNQNREIPPGVIIPSGLADPNPNPSKKSLTPKSLVPNSEKKSLDNWQDVPKIPSKNESQNDQPETIPFPPKRVNPPGTGSPDRLPDPQNSQEPKIEKKAPKLEETKKKESQEEEEGDDDVERQALLSSARNAVKGKGLLLAKQRYENYFRKYKDSVALRLEYIGVLLELQLNIDTLKEFRALVLRFPSDVSAHVNFGDFGLLIRDNELALQEYLIAVKLDEKNNDNWVRLARTFTFQGNFFRAQEIYDTKLCKLQPGVDKEPRQFASLLMDLHRFDLAGFWLDVKIDEKDKILKRLRLRQQVRFAIAHCKWEEAEKRLTELGQENESKLDLLTLGEELFGTENYEWAVIAFQQLLVKYPDNRTAMLSLARANIRLYQPEEAWRWLQQCPDNPQSDRLKRIALADYHYMIGEFHATRAIYLGLLEQEPRDYEVRFYYANLLEVMREDEKAKAELNKIPKKKSIGMRAQIQLAVVLTNQRRFPEAVEVCRQLQQIQPGNGYALAQMITTFGKWHQVENARIALREFNQHYGNLRAFKIPLGLSYGKVLVDHRLYADAVRVYQEVVKLPMGSILIAYYGLGRSLEGVGEGDAGRAAIQTGLTLGYPPFLPIVFARNHILLSDIFIGDFADAPTVPLLQAVLHGNRDHLPALIRLAEVQSRQARPSADTRPALQTMQQILKLSPQNSRTILNLARTYTITQEWIQAIQNYDLLINADPDLLLPMREKARSQYAFTQFKMGQSTYLQAQTPSGEALLQQSLSGLLGQDPYFDQMIGPAIASKSGVPHLRSLALQVMNQTANPVLGEAIYGKVLDAEARSNEATLASLEGEIKDNQWRPFYIQPIARKLLDLEASNTSVWFDLGQSYSVLRQTHNAINTYNEDLGIDPLQREPGVAINRANYELDPQANFNFNFFSQRGRNGLASIDSLRLTTSLRLPYGDETDYFEMGYTRAEYRPTDDRVLPGNIPFLRVQQMLFPQLIAYGQLNLEQYPNRFQTRPTFDIGDIYTHTDQLKFRSGLFLENVVQNGESLRQDIFRYGGRLGVDYQFNRRLAFSGTYTNAQYSDRNASNEFYFTGDYTIYFAPNQLKFVLVNDMLTYRSQTVFGTGPDPIVGAIHPYFAPSFFNYGEARIEWTQWVSRDFFAHSNQCWYTLSYGLGFDNFFNNYNTGRAAFNCDVKPWFTVGADIRGSYASVYHYESAMVYMVVRFPWPG